MKDPPKVAPAWIQKTHELRPPWPLVARFYNKSLLTVREFVRVFRVIKCKAKVVKPRRVGDRRDATIKPPVASTATAEKFD
jgi:hypothetical protein